MTKAGTEAVLLFAQSEAELSRPEVCRLIMSPQWSDAATECNDWRNHVPKPIREAWPMLSQDAKLIAFAFAYAAAEEEDWDAKFN